MDLYYTYVNLYGCSRPPLGYAVVWLLCRFCLGIEIQTYNYFLQTFERISAIACLLYWLVDYLAKRWWCSGLGNDYFCLKIKLCWYHQSTFLSLKSNGRVQKFPKLETANQVKWLPGEKFMNWPYTVHVCFHGIYAWLTLGLPWMLINYSYKSQ